MVAEKNLESSKSKLDNYFIFVRLVLTKVPQYFLPFWYGKEPMLWLPYGWFPYYAEWIMSFPSAPMGSVSAPSWQLACSGFITLVSELLVFVLTALSKGTKTEEARKSPQGPGPKATVPVVQATTDGDGEKKER